MTPDVSVVVCTYERPAHLQRCLDALCGQESAREYEIIVVDGSPSRTARDLTSASRFPECSISYHPYTEAGLSAARNEGYRQAAGEYVLYVDDDAVPASDWIDRLAEGLERDAEIVIGPSRPPDSYQRPAWLSADLERYLGFFDLGDREQTVPRGEIAGTGANMGFERQELVELGGFDERLGRQHGGLLSREELDLFRRADQTGLTCKYVPAPVTHAVDTKDLTRRFFERRLFYEGVSEFREFRAGRGTDLLTKVLKLGLRVPYHTVRYLHAVLTGDEASRLTYYCRLLEAYGFASAPLR